MSQERLASALADRYRLERELGAGGMATVYLAEDLKHKRRVAIKVLRPELAAVIGAERFLVEIQTTANLQHPHILPLHDSGEVNGTVFYVMPFIDGESLRDRLQRQKQLPVVEAVRIASEVASALDYAHRHGVIHRDIKPENILLHDGQALVADFGIALAASKTEGSSRMTETGMSLGTPHYMSPEQAMGERDLDARTDIYAVGCVLYEMLAGEPPFTGPTPQAIVAKVMTTVPGQLTELRSTVPRNVAAAVHTALQKLPADRFANARDLVSALNDASYGREGSAVGGASSRSARAPTLVLGGVALLATLAALWGWFRPLPPADAEVVRFGVSVPTGNFGGFNQHLAMSRDGRSFAYIAPNERGTLTLFVQRFDRLEPQPVAEDVTAMGFAPDGESMAVLIRGKQLVVVPSDGGAPRTLLIGVDQFSLLDWSREGFVYYTPEGGADGVWRIPAAGGTAERVVGNDTVATEASGFNRPAPSVALPGGKGLLVTYYRGPGVESDVAVVHLQTGHVTYLVKGRAPRYAAGHLLFVMANGTLMAAPFDPSSMGLTGPARSTGIVVAQGSEGQAGYAVSEDGSVIYSTPSAGRSLLAWVDRSGNEEVVDADLWREFNGVSLSPDGQRIAMGINDPGQSAIWTYGLEDRTMSRLTFDGTLTWRPLWSGDGSRIAYSSDRESPIQKRALWVQPSDGSGAPQALVESERHAQEITWSTDGRAIAYREGFSDGTTLRDIYLLRSGDDTTRRPFVATGADEQNPKLSPDGRWLAYVSNQSGAYEVYVQPFPGGPGRWQVSTGGGTEPLWARDGAELYYRSADRDLVAVPIQTGAGFTIGARRVLFPTLRYHSDPNGTSYDITPDGRRFLMIKRPVDQELVVVLHWIQELRTP